MSFADKCPHCEHYHEKQDMCCFCGTIYIVLSKSIEQHRKEIDDLKNLEEII